MSTATPSSSDDVPSRFQVDFTGRTLLGIYLVEGKLAEGGMGAVYLATDTNLGRRVVVKVPHARFLGEPGFRGRFHREISELVRLEHPHIVRILARGEEDEVPFFVLQYLGGRSLEDRIRTKASMEPEAKDWLPDIAATLDHVHAQGVVHRDVKPANILFDESGHVFLSDFGVVKALEDVESAGLTEAGTGVGSPFYMAPEQAVGGPVGAAADQYALASTLYESLCGVPPYGRGSLVEVMLRKQQAEAPPLSGKGADIPDASQAALRRAISKDPAARFPTCAAFAEAYARGFAPRDVAAAAAPDRRASVRVRWAAVAAAAVVIAAGLSTRWFGLAGTSAGSTPATATVTPRPSGEIFVLAGKGAEPRRSWRTQYAAGTTDRFVSRMTQTIRQEMTGEKGFEGTFSTDQPIETRVESVEPDGRAHVSWTLAPARARADGEKSAEFRVERQRLYDALGVTRASTIAGPFGGTLELAVERKPGLPPRAVAVLGGIEEQIRAMSSSVPDEPIGVGAVWDVTRAAAMFGIRYQEIASYEVASVNGDRMVLKIRGAQNALPQGYTPPGLPPGTKAEIKSFQTSLEGEIEFDATRPAPTRFEAKGRIAMESSVVGARVPKDATFRFECTFENHMHRD